MKKKDDPSNKVAPVAPYDPSVDLQLDLTHDEKLRVTALMLAIQYYERTIVQDGALYSAMKAHNVELRPAHPDHVLDIAMQFVTFLGGGVPLTQAELKAIEAEAFRTEPTEKPVDKETADYVRDYKPPKGEEPV